jgi:PAS domain S-box-containing protein
MVSSKVQPPPSSKGFEDALHRVLEESDTAVFVADAETGMLRHANRRGRALVGRTLAEIRGMHQWELHPAEDAATYEQRFRTFVETEGMDLSQQTVVQASGRRVTMHVSGTIVEVDGRRIAVGFFWPEAEREKAATLATAAVRARLLHNLHDGLGQHLASLSARLQMLVRRSAGSELQTDAEEALGLVRGAIDELRGLMRGLGPRRLDEAGLGAALRGLANDPWPFGVNLEVSPSIGPLTEALEHAIFRMAQEALSNAARHSEAAHVDLLLLDLGGTLRLVVEDDGNGASGAPGHGLRGIARRARALGGSMVIDRKPGAGTMLRVDLPLADVADTRPPGR